MPLGNYGVLTGKAIEVRLGSGRSPHYQVHLVDNTTDYRIAINVQSALTPSELEYLVVDNFHHPITSLVEPLPLGFTEIERRPGTGALDYIRGNLFDRSLMVPLPYNVPGVDNDLNEKIDRVMQRAMADENSVVYAFGERFGPEPSRKDRYFGFLPGNGIHNIHMNQSNVGRFVSDDGVWQDGGLLVNFPDSNHWIAIFLKFQSQGWHTDDNTGHKIGASVPTGAVPAGAIPVPGTAPDRFFLPTTDEPQGLVRIVSALVNSIASPETELVTIINTAPHSVSLNGWALLDTQENKQPLSGSLEPSETRTVQITQPVALSNKGGVITIVDENGLKVDGVSYTKEQASHPGWTIVFR